MATLQDYQAREHLLNVLRERGIAIGSDNVAGAFASSKTRDQMISWVKEYCQEATLLTQDELSLLETGAIGSPHVSFPDTKAPALDERSIKSAIKALHASTLMIEKHANALESQRTALEAFQASQYQRAGTHAGFESPHRSQSTDTSNRAAQATLEDSVALFREDLHTADQQAARAVANTKALIDERLHADDTVLAALSSVAPRALPLAAAKVSAGDDGSSATAGGAVAALPSSTKIDQTTIEKWCEALNILRASELNHQLDTTISTHQVTPPAYHNKAAAAAALEDAEAQLNAQRSQIPDVLDLVTQATLQRPLTRLLRSSKIRASRAQHAWLQYVLNTLEHMVAHTERLAEGVQHLHAYNHALGRVRSEFLATSTTRGGGITTASGSGGTSESHSVTPAATAETTTVQTQAGSAAVAGQRPHSQSQSQSVGSTSRPATSMHSRADSRAIIASNLPTMTLGEQVLRRFNIPAAAAAAAAAASLVPSSAATTSGALNSSNSPPRAAPTFSPPRATPRLPPTSLPSLLQAPPLLQQQHPHSLLAAAAMHHSARLHAQLGTSTSATVEQLARSLAPAARAAQDVLAQVYAHSPWSGGGGGGTASGGSAVGHVEGGEPQIPTAAAATTAASNSRGSVSTGSGAVWLANAALQQGLDQLDRRIQETVEALARAESGQAELVDWVPEHGRAAAVQRPPIRR